MLSLVFCCWCWCWCWSCSCSCSSCCCSCCCCSSSSSSSSFFFWGFCSHIFEEVSHLSRSLCRVLCCFRRLQALYRSVKSLRRRQGILESWVHIQDVDQDMTQRLTSYLDNEGPGCPSNAFTFGHDEFVT